MRPLSDTLSSRYIILHLLLLINNRDRFRFPPAIINVRILFEITSYHMKYRKEYRI